VLIIKVDRFDAQALEACLAGTDHEFGPPVGKFAVAAADIAEFRRQHDFSAAPFDRLADEFLIVAGTIGV
jgi:hypothetical protein